MNRVQFYCPVICAVLEASGAAFREMQICLGRLARQMGPQKFPCVWGGNLCANAGMFCFFVSSIFSQFLSPKLLKNNFVFVSGKIRSDECFHFRAGKA